MGTALLLVTIGRIFLGLFFVIAGIRNFMKFSKRAVMATNYGWSLPVALTAAGFAVQLAGGLLVTFGIWTGWGAAALILFLIAATALFHNVLMFKGEERLPHLYFTLVNLALVGYCLMVIGTSP
jgi:putative oxidoreductase